MLLTVLTSRLLLGTFLDFPEINRWDVVVIIRSINEIPFRGIQTTKLKILGGGRETPAHLKSETGRFMKPSNLFPFWGRSSNAPLQTSSTVTNFSYRHICLLKWKNTLDN